MIKSRKKVIYVSTVTVVLLSCVGVGSYFISTNFQEPVASQFEAKQNQYIGATTSLNKPYNINQNISFNDWIIQNMPSKIEFSKARKTFIVSAPSNSPSNPQEIVAFEGTYSDVTAGSSYMINFLTSEISNRLPLSSLKFSTIGTNLNYQSKSYDGDLVSNLSLEQDTVNNSLYKLDNFNSFNITKTINPLGTGQIFNYAYSVTSALNGSAIYSQNISGNNSTIIITINGVPGTSSLGITLTQDNTSTNTYKFSYRLDGVVVTQYKDYYPKVSAINLPSSIDQLGLFDFISFIG